MSLLDQILPTPRLVECDEVDLAGPPERVFDFIRHHNLGSSPWVRGLFALRTLPSRIQGKRTSFTFRLDDMVSTKEHAGFQILADDPPNEVVVGAIGKVWNSDIPFLHMENAKAFTAFHDEGFIKIAWAISVAPLGDGDSRLKIEVRVDSTDEASWMKFEPYFRLIGPASRFIRRIIASTLERELGTPEQVEALRVMAGDALLKDAIADVTHGITIDAPPEKIWPWLMQMGCGRAGFYSIDWLDNGGVKSARELHPELTQLHVGELIPARPEGGEGFEVLEIDEPRSLVLGGLYDSAAAKQLPFSTSRPDHYWQVTWAFVLEPLDAKRTRLHVRARAAFPESERMHAAWIRPVHHFMESAQLRHLKRRVEGRLARDDLSDVLEGVGGAAIATFAFLTPFLRSRRKHYGLDRATAARELPGDQLIAEPSWSWTHGIEIDAPAERVWPWIAQVGADRAGFYSYQWLENVLGCDLSNADRVHPEWTVASGGSVSLHPKMRPLPIVEVQPGRCFVVYGAADAKAREANGSWAEVSWLFLVEPLEVGRCRFISRFRSNCSSDLATRLAHGPALIEPIGFAMDRRMLRGVKLRVERELPLIEATAYRG